jgi:hypothetical protein
MNEYGAAMGREQWLKGTNVMLGPGVNLARVPWNGRNFEYQGEDPWLASVMVASEVWGIQSQNVSGCGQIGQAGQRHKTLDAVAGTLQGPRCGPLARCNCMHLWPRVEAIA